MDVGCEFGCEVDLVVFVVYYLAAIRDLGRGLFMVVFEFLFGVLVYLIDVVF